METQKQEKKNRFGPLAAAAYFAFAGVGGLLSGFTHLSKLSSDFSGIVLSDTLFNSLIGILNLVSAYLLWKRKKVVIWVYAVLSIIVQIYAPIMGRGINIVMLVFNGFFLALLFIFNKNQLFESQEVEAINQ